MEALSTICLNSATVREVIFKYNNFKRPIYVIVDTLLGILILYYFVEYEVFDYLPTFTNNTVKTLEFIIEWILHHPGGLKLNSQLNSVLAAFFRGHIQLWRAYMFVLYGSQLGQVISCSALFGASIFLSACSDLIILTTMHFFCFYIYSVR
ncbi:hypothetical protein M3Y97_01046700 [Aphelenchoides bicaudatus]|nr:hypothetical protein M3Y97_01046700 [Aphelenchoides bicaudatus]